MKYIWNILKDVPECSLNLGTYGILILNTPLVNHDPSLLSTLWNNAAWRITVDGGTDTWFDFIKTHNLSLPLPHQVTGDFDSIKPETLKMCSSMNVDIVETPDQNYTDLEKALNVLFKYCPQKLDCFAVIQTNIGRLDQTFQNLNILSKMDLPGYVFSSDSITWLLLSGYHRIHIPPYLIEQEEYCGILPFQNGTITSKGLKWDLDNMKLEFGGFISSSNTYSGSPEVIIETDKIVIWTMGLGSKLVQSPVQNQK